jgi:hypothetical protein
MSTFGRSRHPLVYRPAYNGDVAAGQLAVFQGASEVPISDPYGPSESGGRRIGYVSI